jgi:hypothetical protein
MATSETTATSLITRATAVGIDVAAQITEISRQQVRTAEDLSSTWKPENRTPERITRRYAEQLVDLVKLFNRREIDLFEERIAARERTAHPAAQDSAPTGDAQAPRGWSRVGTHLASGECDNCGGRGRAHARTDASGIPGRVCGRCAGHDELELSFA